MEKKAINLYDAIAQMRQLSSEGKDFSMAFMSCDTTREKSAGMVEVPRAKLRSSASDDAHKNSKHLINFLNVETNIPGRFYQILLMYFQGMKVEV